MARRLTSKQREEIRKLRHLTVRDIRRKTGVSLAAIHDVLHEPEAPTKRAARKPKAPAAPETSVREQEAERLERCVRLLEQAARTAASDGDVARSVSALRAVGDLTSKIAQLTPPPPVDPDKSPDMRKAAETFRTKLFELVDRVAAESAT